MRERERERGSVSLSWILTMLDGSLRCVTDEMAEKSPLYIYIYIWRKNGLEESSAIDREVCEVEALVLVVELPVSMLEATDKHNQSSDIMVKFSK